jgi:dipeptidase
MRDGGGEAPGRGARGLRRSGPLALLAAALFATALLGPGAGDARACTTIIVTRGAAADGSLVVTHADDNEMSDQSLVYVPARDWRPGSTRPVYPSAVALGELPRWKALLVPRLVAPDRAPGYAGNGRDPRTIPLGEIPQVPHTYAYLDGNYGVMNEKGLLFGECTDGSKVTLAPEPGKRIFYSSELSRVALERCATAREAIRLMGALIDRYGYYGTGETLPLADRDEAWVMEMAPSPEGTGGLWVAQRVPDGEVFVAANEFRIREVDPKSPDQIVSPRLFEVCRRAGWWKPESGPLDWLSTVSLGEYSHPYYSLRRVWRVLSLLAPSRGFSPWVENGLTRAYPFSVRPDRAVTLAGLRRIHGDHYEGTRFDQTKGVAAGPFGLPDRILGPDDPRGDVGDPKRSLKGAWERPIGVYYCGFVTMCQVRPERPEAVGALCWICLDKPADSVFLPFPVAPLPESYLRGDTRRFDRASAWWNYNFVAGYAGLKYAWMHRDIRSLGDRIEAEAEGLADRLGRDLTDLARTDPEAARGRMARECGAYAEQTLVAWRELGERLIARYADGYVNEPGKMAQEVGYPREWLDRTDWSEGPSGYAPRPPKP